MTINKLQQLLFLYVTIILFQSCKVECLSGKWAHRKTIDETFDNAIFKEPLRCYNSDSKLQFSVFNDSKNLYVYIKATEKIAQMKILRSGLLFKIDTNGKKDYQTSIMYPIPSDKNQKIARLMHDDWETFVSRFSYDHSFMNVKGFKNVKEEELNITNQFGISVNVTWDSINVMRYKATIPFSQFMKDSLTAADSNKVIGFSIYLNAIKEPASKNAPPPTANSSYRENMMRRGNPRIGYNESGPQNEEQAYLFNVRNIKSNYKIAVNPK